MPVVINKVAKSNLKQLLFRAFGWDGVKELDWNRDK